MRIAYGADDRNATTAAVVEYLTARGHEVVDATADEHWPEIGAAVGRAVATGAADLGVVLCWTGTGTATATLNGNTLEYTVEYTGLSGPATAAHFHGPAEAGANAGVVVPFANPASPIHGTATLNDQQKADLMGGKWYANVHTQRNPGGEIRGQMQRAP